MREAWRGVNLLIRVVIETSDGITGILNPAALPGQLYLEKVYPNPFNASAQVTFYLAEGAPVTIDVFDIIGRQLQSEKLNHFPPGRHTVSVDGSAWSSGVYFLRLSTVNDNAHTKLILQK
jgi:serine protease AprX